LAQASWFGWPESADIEKEVTAWFSAKDPARVDTTNGRDAAHAQTGLHDQSSLGLRRSSHQKDGKIVTCERW
jgi:hypothetical protein